MAHYTTSRRRFQGDCTVLSTPGPDIIIDRQNITLWFAVHNMYIELKYGACNVHENNSCYYTDIIKQEHRESFFINTMSEEKYISNLNKIDSSIFKISNFKKRVTSKSFLLIYNHIPF